MEIVVVFSVGSIPKRTCFSRFKITLFLEFPKLFISVLYDWCKVQAIYIDIYLHLALNFN